MRKNYFINNKIIWQFVLVLIVMSFSTSVDAADKLHWYMQQGKGRPLCEQLTKIANSNMPLPDLQWITPNIPWKQVLAIKGVREPEWKELDPLKYEDFFLKARKFIETENTLDEQAIPFVRWFLPPKERWLDKEKRKKRISDGEALRIYRDFVRRGGKLKVFRCDIINNKTKKMYRDFVQYESPEKDFSGWDGYTVQSEPDLKGIHEAGYPIIHLGPGYRLLIYNNNLFSFVGFRRGSGEYNVNQMCGGFVVEENENAPHYLETYFCKIDSEVIKRGKKK